MFSKNRDRLLAGDVARGFFRVVLQLDEVKGLLSDEHFSVDGSLIEAYASHKSLQPREGRSTASWRPFSRADSLRRVANPPARIRAMKCSVVQV